MTGARWVRVRPTRNMVSDGARHTPATAPVTRKRRSHV